MNAAIDGDDSWGFGGCGLGIAGVGLIGGSIAAAVKSRGLFERVVGFGRSEARLEAAAKAGLIDDFSTDYARCDDLAMFVSCVPVDRIADSVCAAARHMQEGSVITDAGSVKQAIVEAVGHTPAPGVAFIGSHPLAGSERQGFEHADADLFAGRVCVMTPTGREPPAAVRAVRRFWELLGSDVVSLSAAEHDAILARTSHLPHVAAAAVAAGLKDEQARFAAGGFRDTTRVASGDPELWAAILLTNREAVGAALDEFTDRCGALRQAIAAGDGAALRRLLEDAKSRRDRFVESFK